MTSNPDDKSLMKQRTYIVNPIPEEKYEKNFQKQIERMTLYIQNNAEYFEHKIK